MKTQIMKAEEAKEAGWLKYNDGPHLCVDVPDGRSTIVAKLSNGRQILFSFLPYEKNGIPRCIDIEDHGGEEFPNFPNEGVTCYRQHLIAFSGAGPDAFRSDETDRPVTKVALLLKEAE